ncbi:MAG: extracellular solute-binding protein [Bdellovibrionales bacterium]
MRTRFYCCLAFLFLFSSSVLASPQHGLALHGHPKYKSNFTHLDYADPNALKGGTVRLAAQGTFDNLNPFILKGVAAAGTGMIFETLMESTLDEPFSQYGLIAKSADVASDKSRVTYVLRENARFQDNKPITADDVVFSFKTLREKGHPFYRSYYKDVARVEKNDIHKVTFVFKQAGNTELPLIMGQMPILPQHYFKDKDFAATTLTPPLGSGPYKIDTFVPGRSITYKRDPNWWGKDLPINKGRYNFDEIVYDYYRDSTVMIEAFLAGRYDFRSENTAKYWATSYDTPAVQKGEIVRKLVDNKLPAGMQGFVFNLRRSVFQDPRVREAITLAFDFEWGNKNIAFDAYKRTSSYFANSDLAATELPDRDELTLLAPFKDQLPKEVFEKVYEPPKTDGSGNLRQNLRRAIELLEQAGWHLKSGTLTDKEGHPLTFTIVDNSPLFERWTLPFLRNLERLGIKAQYRVVDAAQYQNLMNDFNFDMTVKVFGQSLSPGNEQYNYWSSQSADRQGSQNLIGIKSPVVDALIDKIVKAKDRKQLITACHALDRVLLWGHYVVPHWYLGGYRLAYWNKFGQPEITPPYGFDMVSLWWAQSNKR